MYTDMTVDGCLKGLGQQVWSMAINILDAVLGLVLVWTLLPVHALHAYIGIIYFTEAVNFIFEHPASAAGAEPPRRLTRLASFLCRMGEMRLYSRKVSAETTMPFEQIERDDREKHQCADAVYRAVHRRAHADYRVERQAEQPENFGSR